jgi:anthraniloyl-CoA monooxygenase
MKIVCIGGGPAGLYFGLLMKLQDPANEVTVVERNRPYDTFGWGVVFSDATMDNLREADPVSARTIGDAFNHWDDIDIHFKGRTMRSGGHGFIGIGRKKLLNILQARCEDVGVKLVFENFVQDDQAIARAYDADLVIASDGINSQVRMRYADTFRPDIDQRRCRFVWLGTTKVFDAFTFAFVQTEHGWFQAHAYRYEDGMSTIGSGTKLALEDAIELARSLRAAGSIEGGLHHYEEVRSVEVLKIQNAARNSTEWFENVERYAGLEPEQFAYSLLTRSQRISHENLRLRDAGWLEGFERWIAEHAGQEVPAGQQPPLPMLTPYQARGVRLKNRIMVSPMAMYSCTDGVPGDFHLVHLGARAMGGAGLVMVEMTCVSPEGRITPGCPGLWDDAQGQAFRRIVDFVHGHSDARIGVQLGHAGRKGSTQLGWQKIDHPLEQGNWPLLSASALPYIEGLSQVPRAMDRAGMDAVRDQFVAATRRAVEAGFDWLELHCAHGYLLSSFISPLTNQRDDEYGGSLDNRLRFPLEVFHAVRAAWPQDRPMSVRISAHDWVEGGITPDDAVEIARRFKAAGADMIDCSSGQVSKQEKPVYGRMFQTPFADRVRNEAGIATIAVGAIFEADHANAIIASGRADLCALARPHLADAAWTLRESARVGARDVGWPRQYLAGKRQLETNFERAAAMAQLDIK